MKVKQAVEMNLAYFDRYWCEFLWAMTLKEIKARYKKAVLGFLWIFLNPLLQMGIIGLIFQFFVPVKVDNYFLFLFTGLLPWNFFAYSMNKSTPAMVFERSLIKKSKFPREAIVLSIVFSNLFHMLIAWTMLLLVLVIDKVVFDQYTIQQLLVYVLRLGWSIPLILWLTMLTVGFSLLFAALNVKYRDINFFVQAIVPLWFYATPIVYTLQVLPSSLSTLLYLNPLTGLMELFHLALLDQPVSRPDLIVVNICCSFVILLFGSWYFAKQAPYFDDWV